MSTTLLWGPGLATTIETADRCARHDWPVLIRGETGVGKELFARRIHAESLRSQGPFMAVNCGAIPGTLFESELFGFERGAFSGAMRSHPGLLRSAEGGTLFLDEVGDLELNAQVKLLRWLDSGEVRALGGVHAKRSDVRLIAATHVDLVLAVAEGRFRLDLFERLNVLTLEVPALRERTRDIPLLARSIMAELGGSLCDESLGLLQEQPWPGNVRQLRNVLMRALVQSAGQLTPQLIHTILTEERRLERALAMSKNRVIVQGSLDEIERFAIEDRLSRCHGNKKRTARELGIAKSTLHEKLRRWQNPASHHRADSVGTFDRGLTS